MVKPLNIAEFTRIYDQKPEAMDKIIWRTNDAFYCKTPSVTRSAVQAAIGGLCSHRRQRGIDRQYATVPPAVAPLPALSSPAKTPIESNQDSRC